MRKVFSQDNTCIRTGFCRTKSLKDMLVRPSVESVTMHLIDNPGCFKCHCKVCDACQNFLLPYRRIISVATGKSYKIRQHMSCRTDFVIYSTFCKKCNRQCVSSAIDFRCRLYNYKSHIKNKNAHVDLHVNHFIDNSSDHPLDCLKLTLIEQVSNKTEKDLEEREGYWQAQLWTLEPFGFNAKKRI